MLRSMGSQRLTDRTELGYQGGFPGGSAVKNPPAMQEMWAYSLVRKIPWRNAQQPVHSEGDSPGISLEGMMLKLKLQYFGHLMRRVDSLEKTLMQRKIEGEKRRGR